MIDIYDEEVEICSNMPQDMTLEEIAEELISEIYEESNDEYVMLIDSCSLESRYGLDPDEIQNLFRYMQKLCCHIKEFTYYFTTEVIIVLNNNLIRYKRLR